jgi:uncharacterized protein (DUF433 family)
MPVSAIPENIEAGASVDEVMQWYDGLNREQVRQSLSSPFAVSIDSPLRLG